MRPLPDAATQALSALVTRRRQLVTMLTAEQNRRTRVPAGPIREDIDAHLHWLQQRLKCVEQTLRTTLRQSPVWRAKDNLLQSVPGVGPVLATTLLGAITAWASRGFEDSPDQVADFAAEMLGPICARIFQLAE